MWAVAGAGETPPPVIAVLYPEAGPPYRQLFAEIVGGIERGAGEAAVRALALPDPPDVPALRRWLDRLSPAVAITLGRMPAEAHEKSGSTIPRVVGALDASPQTRPGVAGVGLAVDPALLFATLKQLAPARQRVWPASCLNRNCRAPASRCSALASACWRRSTVSVSGSAAAAPASAL